MINEAKNAVAYLTKAGIQYPADHIVFTFLAWLVIYVPTKVLYILLSICYGPSAQSHT